MSATLRRRPVHLTRLPRNYTRANPGRAAHQSNLLKILVEQAVSSEPVSTEFPVKQGNNREFSVLGSKRT
jgi:hypothetical protein